MKVQVTKVLGLAVALLAVGGAQFAGAVVIDFESPAYSAGALVPQNGWAPAGFLGGATNGTVEVSASSPLSGSQSLLYTQTNGNFGSDVVIDNAITVGTDGTSAADVTIGFQMEATSLSGTGPGLGYGVVGFYLGNAVSSGATPFGIRLVNAGHSTGNIQVYRGGTGGVGDYYLAGDIVSSAYPAGDTIDFSVGIDFDLQMFTLAATNATTGVPYAATPGPFPFSGGFAGNGDGTFSVDALALLRFGSGRIDNITLTAAIPEPTSCVLALAGLGAVICGHRRKR